MYFLNDHVPFLKYVTYLCLNVFIPFFCIIVFLPFFSPHPCPDSSLRCMLFSMLADCYSGYWQLEMWVVQIEMSSKNKIHMRFWRPGCSNGKKWLDSEYMLKLAPTGFAGRLNVGIEEEESRMGSQGGSAINWDEGVYSGGDMKRVRLEDIKWFL